MDCFYSVVEFLKLKDNEFREDLGACRTKNLAGKSVLATLEYFNWALPEFEFSIKDFSKEVFFKTLETLKKKHCMVIGTCRRSIKACHITLIGRMASGKFILIDPQVGSIGDSGTCTLSKTTPILKSPQNDCMMKFLGSNLDGPDDVDTYKIFMSKPIQGRDQIMRDPL